MYGEIKNFSITQLNYYNFDVNVFVDYFLSSIDEVNFYAKSMSFTHHITKDSHGLISLTNYAISSNIQLMFDDDDFMAAVSDHCLDR